MVTALLREKCWLWHKIFEDKFYVFSDNIQVDPLIEQFN